MSPEQRYSQFPIILFCITPPYHLLPPLCGTRLAWSSSRHLDAYAQFPLGRGTAQSHHPQVHQPTVTIPVASQDDSSIPTVRRSRTDPTSTRAIILAASSFLSSSLSLFWRLFFGSDSGSAGNAPCDSAYSISARWSCMNCRTPFVSVLVWVVNFVFWWDNSLILSKEKRWIYARYCAEVCWDFVRREASRSFNAPDISKVSSSTDLSLHVRSSMQDKHLCIRAVRSAMLVLTSFIAWFVCSLIDSTFCLVSSAFSGESLDGIWETICNK